MEIVKVTVKSGSYDILIENGSLDLVGATAVKLVKGKKAVVVTDSNVYPLYGDRMLKSLSQAGFDAHITVLEAGEEHKRLHTVKKLYAFFIKQEITRSDIIVALGGGVTGDITGFAAGTYLRGVPYIQVPTTLLAQIDSSVGGKTGVDLEDGKNLVGIFNQPKAVIIDPMVLSTLSEQIFSDGMAEAIKYGCIKDKALFNDILLKPKTHGNLQSMIASCVKIKRDVVEADEFDMGERMLLNFGHTIGHAIEKCGNYTKYTHGSAVACGMVAACRLGEKMGICESGTSDKIIDILNKYNLPILTNEKSSDIMNAILNDKKRLGNEINFILLKSIGQGIICKIPIDKISNLL